MMPSRRSGAKQLGVRALATALATVAVVTTVAPAGAVAPAVTSSSPVPAGFRQTTLLRGLKNPSVFAFAPNGDIYIGEQAGTILIYRNGALVSPAVVTLPTDSAQEMGLLGIAFDPNFSTNGYLYVSYTTPDAHAQLSRITVVNGIASLSSEKVFLKGTNLQTGTSSANDVQVGPDGKLWWSVGDAGPPDYSNARTLTNINGKILRFNLDGTIPPDNPFVNVVGAVPAIYAYGLRNPFRFTFLPNGQAMTGDTGSSYWEELDTIQRGGNYGWNFYEGNCFSCGFINPAYAYGHLPVDGAASAITAYFGSSFPQRYDNAVFFGDYNRRDIEAVTFDPSYGTETSDIVFDTAAGTIADLREGPDGNLYFVSIYDGTFTKISAVGPFPPVAAASASPSSGVAPLAVQFSSAGSAEAYGRKLSYSWSFGDGSAPSSSPNPSHTYSTDGTYTAVLTVTRGSHSAQSSTQVSVGNDPPAASITSPAAGTTYSGGSTVTYSGTADDARDGQLPASDFTWQVDFYSHGVAQPFYSAEVPHPFYGPLTGATSAAFTIPTDVSQTPGTFYRITMTAIDSLGLRTVVTRDIHPLLTTWSASSNVPGGSFVVDGTWQTSTFSTQDVVGIQHVLMGVPAQILGGTRYRFAGWADGNAFVDSFTSTASSSTLSALLDPVQTTVPPPWNSADVGGPTTPGDADYAPTTDTFYADGGGTDVWQSNDQFHYVYQALNGDGTIIARIRYQTESNPWTKAGLMIKESTATGSPYIDALVTPDVSPNTPNINGVGCVFPATAPGAGCDSPLPPVTPAIGNGIRVQYNYTREMSVTSLTALTGFTSPDKWLKLQRAGNTFTAWYSIDGSHWVSIGSTTFTMATSATVGLFVCSHNSRQPSSVAFDNVTVS